MAALRDLGRSSRFWDDLPRDLALAERVAATVERAATVYGLNLRESQVLAGMLAGDTNVEIARRLGLDLSTVRWHLVHIVAKLHARNRSHALVVATAEAAPEIATTTKSQKRFA